MNTGQLEIGPASGAVGAFVSGVDLSEANLDRLPVHENGERIAVRDTDDLSREVFGGRACVGRDQCGDRN